MHFLLTENDLPKHFKPKNIDESLKKIEKTLLENVEGTTEAEKAMQELCELNQLVLNGLKKVEERIFNPDSPDILLAAGCLAHRRQLCGGSALCECHSELQLT